MNEGRATFAEVERVFGRIRLVKSGSLLLPQSKDGVEDLPAAEDPTVENSQGPMLSRAGRAAVIIGLPRNVLLLRFLELPNVDDAALPGLVSYELDRHLPFPPEEAYYTFQKLRQQGNTAQVLLVAARRVDVKRAIEQVEQLGLTPTGVDVSAIAATNALFFRNQNWTDKVLILIEVIEGEATVNLVHEGMLVSSRTVPFTDDSFTSLFSELKRVSEIVPQTPEKILVCGGSEDLCHRLKQELDLPAEQWSPGSASVDASTFGLALKGLVKLPIELDLLPTERKVRRRERVVVTMFALLALVGVLGLTWGISAASLERRTLYQLDEQLARVEAEAAAGEALKTEFTLLRDRLQQLERLVVLQDRPLLVMKELVSILPQDVVLQELVLKEDKLKIRGSTGTSASALISKFERSFLFENASFTSPISTRGKGRESFQIQASIMSGSKQVERKTRQGGRK